MRDQTHPGRLLSFCQTRSFKGSVFNARTQFQDPCFFGGEPLSLSKGEGPLSSPFFSADFVLSKECLNILQNSLFKPILLNRISYVE